MLDLLDQYVYSRSATVSTGTSISSLPLLGAAAAVTLGTMSYWWMTSKPYPKLVPIVDLKNQTRLLSDGSRVAACLDGDELIPFLFDDAKTVYHAVRRGLRESGNGMMLGSRKKQADGSEPYIWLTYKEVIDRSIDLSCGLIDLGIPPGQKTFIGIFAKNCPEWIISELAIYNSNCVLIPLYETLGPDSCRFIVNQSEMKIVICDYENKALCLLSHRSSCPLLKDVIIIDGASSYLKAAGARVGLSIYSFEEIEKRGREMEVKPRLQGPSPDDLCTICYTSGTTGRPKGVMLTHGNVIACATVLSYIRNVGFYSSDVMISFLPLAHMFERLLECAVFTVGARIGYYRGDIRTLAEDIKELRPTIVPLVPRVLNRVYDKVMAEANKSFTKRTLLNAAIAFKTREVQKGIIRTDSFFDTVVFKKIREALGGRVKLMITGSAPLAENVMKFARAAMGCVVLEGYGQTECVAACTVGVEGDSIPGHVGIPSVCNAIKLVDVPELGYFTKDQAGEVCIRGYNVFKGYYKDETMTKEVLDSDGWLHTGDIGQWTATGTLKIIDRKKHIFKLSQGEYVAPEKIENVYSRSKFVSQSFVHGESLKTCLVGVVVPDPEVLEQVAAKRVDLSNVPYEELCSMAAVKEMILEDMVAVGKKAGLFSFEQVKDVYITSEPFTVENQLLTPTLKSKRPALKEYFSTQLEHMYRNLQ